MGGGGDGGGGGSPGSTKGLAIGDTEGDPDGLSGILDGGGISGTEVGGPGNGGIPDGSAIRCTVLGASGGGISFNLHSVKVKPTLIFIILFLSFHDNPISSNELGKACTKFMVLICCPLLLYI
jgi:hypothetical protein